MKHLVFCLLMGAAIAVAGHRLSPPELGVLVLPNDAEIADLRSTWFRQTGRLPNSEELQGLIDNELNQDLLFAEALRRNFHLDDMIVRQRLLRDAGFLKLEGSEEAQIKAALGMGVHLSDAMIRRRMIQRMEALATGSIAPVPESELREAYRQQQNRWVTEPRVTFSQIFFSVDSRENPVRDAEQLLSELTSKNEEQEFEQVKNRGDFFMHGQYYRNQPTSRLQRYFGQEFVDKMTSEVETFLEAGSDAPFALGSELKAGEGGREAEGVWLGPLPSAYGQHLILLTRLQHPSVKPFEEVRDTLEYEAKQALQREQLSSWLLEMRKRYRLDSSGLPG